MESPQTAFRDAMGSAHSSSLSWKEQVQEEEQQQRGSAPGDGSRIKSSLDPDAPLPMSKGEAPVMFPWLMMALSNMTQMS